MSKTLAIFPCAGVGSRMNMPGNRSKELLPDPSRWNQPLIEWHLANCFDYDLEPLIITRKEKTDLIEYCKKNGVNYEVVEPGKSWPGTVLASKSSWRDNNILMFPDSRFFPVESLGYIRHNLASGDELSLGVFPVAESLKWLIYTQRGLFEKRKYEVLDSEIISNFGVGVIGFKKQYGSVLFHNLDSSDYDYFGDFKPSLVQLNGFIDLTRTGKIYKYE